MQPVGTVGQHGRYWRAYLDLAASRCALLRQLVAKLPDTRENPEARGITPTVVDQVTGAPTARAADEKHPGVNVGPAGLSLLDLRV